MRRARSRPPRSSPSRSPTRPRARCGGGSRRSASSGVAARTFHAAALAQLRYFAPDEPLQILASKVLPLRNIGNSLPGAYRFRPAGDLATEIERAKNGRVTPADLPRVARRARPADPAGSHAGRLRRVRAVEGAAGRIDFEDLLELTIRLLDEDEHALATVRERYRAFTVDEFQDVNLLQQELLDRWLGPSDELCAVGDDYQAIYGFTGASPRLPARAAGAVPAGDGRPAGGELPLDAAGAGAREPARAAARRRREDAARDARRPGPSPSCGRTPSPEDEAAAIVARVQRARPAGASRSRRWRCCCGRTRARPTSRRRSTRRACRSRARRCSPRRRTSAAQAAARPRRAARRDGRARGARAGLVDPVPDGLGERELTRQNDLARLVRLAQELDDGERDVAAWVEELRRRFGPDGGARRAPAHATTAQRGSSGTPFPAPASRRRNCRALSWRGRRASGGETPALRRADPCADARPRVSWAGRPSRFLRELGVALGRVGASGRGAARSSATKTCRLRIARSRTGAGAGGRRSGVRRLPQLDPRRNRGAPPADDRRAGVGARRRPCEVGALRAGGP